MKKIFLAVISLLFVSMAFGQDGRAAVECPQGTCGYFSFSITTFNFHKPRTNCLSGFGLCVRGNIGGGCKPCETMRSDGDTRIEKGVVKCWGEIINGKLELHIPAEISDDQKFANEDLSTFSVDTGSLTLTLDNKTFLTKQGKYPVNLRENDLVVLIDLE